MGSRNLINVDEPRRREMDAGELLRSLARRVRHVPGRVEHDDVRGISLLRLELVVQLRGGDNEGGVVSEHGRVGSDSEAEGLGER